MTEDITCVYEGVGEQGGIYISNLKTAKNKQALKRYNIKAIVTVIRGFEVKHDEEDVPYHLFVHADDVEHYDLAQHFEETYSFIDSVRKKTNVLVHCYAGISRSATIVIAYLIKKYGYSLQNVISMVKRKRRKINPNKGFLEQLKRQAKLNGQTQNEQFKNIQKILNSKSSSKQKRIFSAPKKVYLSSQLPNQQKKISKCFQNEHKEIRFNKKFDSNLENSLIEKKLYLEKNNSYDLANRIEKFKARVIAEQRNKKMQVNSQIKHTDSARLFSNDKNFCLLKRHSVRI